MSLETLASAIERLTARGYRGDFRAERGGLRDVTTRVLHAPEALVIEETVRFEGESDPQDQAVLFGLRAREGEARGTYVVAYGPGMDRLDVEMVRRLGAPARRLPSKPLLSSLPPC